MNASTGFPWHEPGKIEQLTALYLEGLSCSQIATAMSSPRQKLTRCSIIGKISRLKLNVDHRRPATGPSSVDGIRWMREGGKPKPERKPAAPKTLTVKRDLKQGGTRGNMVKPLPELASAPERPSIVPASAKPWLERGFGECNWIVAGRGETAISCCLPIDRRGWCSDHAKLGLQPEKRRPLRAPADFTSVSSVRRRA